MSLLRARPLALLLAVCALAPPVTAAPSAAEQTYRDAAKAEAGGDVVGALAKFESIPPAARDFLVRLHIASCKRKLGRFLESARDLEAILADPSVDEATRETAQGDLDELRTRTPKLYVRRSVATADVRATLDGVPLALPVTTPLNPGAHVVAATRDRREIFRREVVLAEGMSLEIEIDAPTSRAPAPPATVVGASIPGPSTSPSSSGALVDRGRSERVTRATGWVLIGLGGLGGLAAVGARVSADSAYHDWQQSCRGGPCDDDARNRTRRWDTATFAAIGVFVTGVGIGATLVLSSSGEARPVTVHATTGAVNGLEIVGSF